MQRGEEGSRRVGSQGEREGVEQRERVKGAGLARKGAMEVGTPKLKLSRAPPHSQPPTPPDPSVSSPSLELEGTGTHMRCRKAASAGLSGALGSSRGSSLTNSPPTRYSAT
jgi:hypothetical protein